MEKQHENLKKEQQKTKWKQIWEFLFIEI